MLIIIQILGIASFIAILMMQPVYAKVVELTKEIKPFSCSLCMAFWTYLISIGIMYQFNIQTVLEAFICSIAVVIIEKQLTEWS